MNNFIQTFSPKSTTKTLAILIAAVTFFFISNHSAFAATYSTVSNGSWTLATVWAKQNTAPSDIHNRDSVLINNRINVTDLKITNGGTLIINDELTAQTITLSGSQSKIVVEPGGTLNAQTITGGTSNNIIYKQNNPLPVTLVLFGVKNNSTTTTNNLVWQTASEFNNAYFSVEKSADGTSFTEAGRVTGKNAPAGAAYAFEDKSPFSRTYYRLKQVDMDGTITYSGIITATINQKLSVNGSEVVFGQPFNGVLRLVNMAGQPVQQASLTQAATFNLPKTLHGIFILQLESAGQVTSQRILL